MAALHVRLRPPHQHHFRIAYNVPLGLPDRWGWVPKMIVRECRTCALSEVLHGAEHREAARNRLLSWESWAPWGLEEEGEDLSFTPLPEGDLESGIRP